MSLWNKEFNVMLLKEVNTLITSNDYLYELKFDGIRACLFVNDNTFKIISRNKKDITHLFPELRNIKKSIKKNVIIDGEIICFANNKISFEVIQNRLHLKNIDRIKLLSNNNPALFVAFDILFLDNDLIDLPLIKRKKILEQFSDTNYFFKSKAYKDSKKLFNFVKKNNLEGIVAKLKNSKYLINTRSDNWVKIKNYQINEFFIGGYEKKKENYLSLKLGEYINNKFEYVGSVSLTKNNSLYNDILKLKPIKNSLFVNYNEDIIYLKPIIKCRVKYIEKTSHNQLRQPIIIRSK